MAPRDTLGDVNPPVRVLVVEDSQTMRRMVVEAIRRREGFVVDEAENGFIALKRLAEGTFDVVLTDVNMPVMDGLKLIHRLRADPRHASVRIAVISTESALEDRERALRLGANAYLTKPVTADEVHACIDSLLATRGDQAP